MVVGAADRSFQKPAAQSNNKVELEESTQVKCKADTPGKAPILAGAVVPHEN